MNLSELKRIRKQQNIKIVDIAASTGLNRDTVTRIENDKGDPSFKNVKLYVEALGLEMRLLIKK